MDGLGIAAIITAATGLLIAFGGGIRYVITMILDAYKKQAANTIEAKNGELAAKDAQIAFLKGEIMRRLDELI